MAEVNVGGVSFKGFGKISALFIVASTIISGGWFGYQLWDQWLDLNERMANYEEPDLSGFDKQIALNKAETDKRFELIEQKMETLSSELSMILQEIELIAMTARELKDDLKKDVRTLQQDSRHTESVVNSIKNNTRDELRLFEQSIKDLEGELELKINKALANPLAGVK